MRHIRSTYHLILCIIVGTLLTACSVGQYISDGEYVLRKNIIETDKKIPRQERITSEEIEKYVKQKPAVFNLWGLREYIYLATADTTKLVNKMIHSLGQAPTILDTTLTRRSADNIKAYLDSRGYFGSEEEYSFRLNPTKRTAEVTYSTFQGDPYRIENINYIYEDNFIESIVDKDSTKLLRPGQVLDINLLGRERSRLTSLLRDNGYYDFSPSYIEFKVDTTIGNHKANVEMIVRQREVGYDAQGQPIKTNSSLYRIGSITIRPDYDATQLTAATPEYIASLDTLNYEGIEVIYSGEEPNLRPKILRKLTTLQSGLLYSDKQVNSTYDNFMMLKYVNSANILFTPDKSGITHPVTFVGEHWSDTAETTEGVIDCEIRLSPALSQNYNVQLEASTTSSFYGLATTLGYQNRNLLRGAELFDMSLTFGYEFIKLVDASFRHATDVGGRVGITLPRFLFPVELDPADKLHSEQTRVELSINDQNRRYYDRTLANVSLGYIWYDSHQNYYSIKPFDVNLVKINYVDQEFLDRLQNPYLKDSYTTQMMAGITGSFIFGEQKINDLKDYRNLRINISTSGNALSAINSLLGSTKNNGHYTMFGIPYAQYVRGDISWAESFAVSENSSVAYRLFGGIVIPYGNSLHESLPSDRLFYAGGINSMRGWTARTLGPGSSAEVETGYPSQFGNLRLEANVEWRFPIFKIVKGALFMDAGNVWYTPNIKGIPEGAAFKFNTFTKQIALNSGFGLRLDLGAVLVRADWGVQLHDPNEPIGQRWVISNFKFRNSSIQFSVGYPF